ncbi:MAG: hypothetical protein DSY77_06465 [Bacteroidetes bacterium]|nr:MAG: hypothetical protein DSY77_06465 [Bacteroidota bacterium]
MDYNHCNCQEIKDAIEYNLKSDGVLIERIPLKNGVIHGQWISKTINSDTIIISNYRDGKLEGDFLQFHENGKIKLEARFKAGRPHGKWTFYNEKERVIKSGVYENGQAKGVWKIFNKKGRKLLLAYDFDLNQYTKNNFYPYYSSKAVLKDDLNEEFVIAYFPNMSVRNSIKPLGGYVSASEYFTHYMNIPKQFFNTYFGVNFRANIEIKQGEFYLKELQYDDHPTSFDGFDPGLPFFVETNDARKLSRVSHTENSLWLLEKRIEQLLLLSGPWVIDEEDNVNFQIQIPIQINSIRKY